jgi:hypothetical protein
MWLTTLAGVEKSMQTSTSFKELFDSPMARRLFFAVKIYLMEMFFRSAQTRSISRPILP